MPVHAWKCYIYPYYNFISCKWKSLRPTDLHHLPRCWAPSDMPMLHLTRTSLMLCTPKPALPLEPPILAGYVGNVGQLASLHTVSPKHQQVSWQLASVSRWTRQDWAAGQWYVSITLVPGNPDDPRRPVVLSPFHRRGKEGSEKPVTGLKSSSYKMPGLG